MVERNPLRAGLLSGLSTPVIDGDGKAAFLMLIYFSQIYVKYFIILKQNSFVNLNNFLKYMHNIFTMFLYISCMHAYNSRNENNFEYVSI